MKPILLTLAAAALALALWLVLGRSEHEPVQGGPAPAPAVAVAPVGLGAPALEPADRPGPELAGGQREAIGEPSRPASPEDFGLSLSPPAATGVTYRVVVRDTEQPVPFAVVTHFDEDDPASSGAIDQLVAGEGFDTILDRFGTHHRCDAEGRVRLPDIAPQVFLRARGQLDGRRYVGLLSERTEERTLEVELERGFEVRVEDLQGRPQAGALVELVLDQGSLPVSSRMSFQVATTGSDGACFLVNSLLQLRDQVEGMLITDPGARVLVGLGGLFERQHEVPVDWSTTTPSELLLRRPPVGRVEVSLSPPEGGVVPPGTLVLLRAGADPVYLVIPDQGKLLRAVGEAGESPVVFEDVERGLAFDLVLVPYGPGETQRLDGLAVPHDAELLAVTFDLTSRVQRLAGRVLDPAGQPLVDRALHFGVPRRNGQAGLEVLGQLRTDAAGRFEVATPWLGEDFVRLVHVPAEGGPQSLELPGIKPVEGMPEVLDLGDLRLQGSTLLLAGSVHDPAGRPLSVPLELTEPFEVTLTDEAGGAPIRGRRGNVQRWELVSDDAGRFEFWGRTAQTELLLTVPSELHLGFGERVVEVGEAGLALVLEPAARFHYRLPGLEPGLEAGLQLLVRGPLTGAGEPGTYQAYSSGSSPPLAPGTYDYELVLEACRLGTVHRGTVQLAAGEQLELGELALERRIRHYRVHVDSPGPAESTRPMVDGLLDGRVYGHAWVDAQGVGHVFSLEPLDGVRVRVVGSSGGDFPVLEGDNFVTLEPQ